MKLNIYNNVYVISSLIILVQYECGWMMVWGVGGTVGRWRGVLKKKVHLNWKKKSRFDFH